MLFSMASNMTETKIKELKGIHGLQLRKLLMCHLKLTQAIETALGAEAAH